MPAAAELAAIDGFRRVVRIHAAQIRRAHARLAFAAEPLLAFAGSVFVVESAEDRLRGAWSFRHHTAFRFARPAQSPRHGGEYGGERASSQHGVNADYMTEESHVHRARRSHERDTLGGADVAWKFEPIYNSPSEWNVTARWMDYDAATSVQYDVLDAMLIADEVRWRASEMIALLFAKSRTLEQVRRALTLSDCINLMSRALSPPRYGSGPNIQPPTVETIADCAR